MDQLHIRAGTSDDVEAILRVHSSSVLGLGQLSYNNEECQSWAFGLEVSQYRDAMTTGGETYLVALNAGKLVGFCSYKENEIVGLYVDPSTSRKGVGSLLIRAAEAGIASARPVTITLNSALSALEFYKSHGYRAEGTRLWKTRGGLEIEVCKMAKELA
ncbi:GNAT family N-acetyltransferase [Pelagibius sp. Alg239-R121]|uniref:GNAT family N-acetyltransferase n=1 Tax=Pelagibius sp. Alg239-R121 TaxID=2993448 RepID=UPI0024A6B436|nr:GNAT family N-acetyltransferase [Pelagibius sp. Alg239-R121]